MFCALSNSIEIVNQRNLLNIGVRTAKLPTAEDLTFGLVGSNRFEPAELIMPRSIPEDFQIQNNDKYSKHNPRLDYQRVSIIPWTAVIVSDGSPTGTESSCSRENCPWNEAQQGQSRIPSAEYRVTNT